MGVRLEKLEDWQWDQLLDAIEAGDVVPVIGSGLIEAPSASSYCAPLSLDELNATHLMENHSLQFSAPAPTLHEGVYVVGTSVHFSQSSDGVWRIDNL